VKFLLYFELGLNEFWKKKP